MDKVKEMLADPNGKISDISQAVGYENPRYFSKVFKHTTGFTPREYREHILSLKEIIKYKLSPLRQNGAFYEFTILWCHYSPRRISLS